MKTLRDLFLCELADILDAEKRIVRLHRKLEKAAFGEELKFALRTHAQDTASHVLRFERIFGLFGVSTRSSPREASLGLLKEADELLREFKGSPAIDAAVVSTAQKVAHYEIVSCGCLHEWAGDLGNNAARDLLADILDQKKMADETLTRLARETCNEHALGEPLAGSTGAVSRG